MPTLTIQLPGQPPVSHVLKDETITIGRMKGNTIVIEDGSISLMHAKITRKDGQFYLKDLNSTNGTIVNGQPIGEVRLRDQDRVRFAEITTQFVADGELMPAPVGTATAVPVASSASAPASLPVGSSASAPVPLVPASAASAAQSATPAKAPTTLVSRPERKSKPNRRGLLVAAAIVVVALPGIGFVVWKSVKSERESSTTASALVAPKTKKTVSAPAPQYAPAKPAPEAKPLPDPAETPTVPTLNIADLVSGLKSAEVTERRQAASALHGAGTEAKEAIPALKEALKDSDAEVQMWAALALVNTQTYDKAVIPILVRALKNDNSVLRQVACLSLGLIPYEVGDKEIVVPALTEAASKDAEEAVRQAAKSALNIVGAENSVQSAAK